MIAAGTPALFPWRGEVLRAASRGKNSRDAGASAEEGSLVVVAGEYARQGQRTVSRLATYTTKEQMMRDSMECEMMTIQTRAVIEQAAKHLLPQGHDFLMHIVRFDGEVLTMAVADVQRCQDLIADLQPERLSVDCLDDEAGLRRVLGIADPVRTLH